MNETYHYTKWWLKLITVLINTDIVLNIAIILNTDIILLNIDTNNIDIQIYR